MVLLVICYWLVIDINSVESLKIAAYNVRTFGESKLNNGVAMNMITKVYIYIVDNFLYAMSRVPVSYQNGDPPFEGPRLPIFI